MFRLMLLHLIYIQMTSSNTLDFPPHFKFGAASSAYQIEGAWNTDGKGESIWDRFTRTHSEVIGDGSTGEMTCDSYHKYRQDVQLAADIGLHFYRFSISWSRLLPSGLSNEINEEGKAYYNNLINELIANNIEPVVTIYHWDLPQRLQNLGGWTNPLISDWFADYARVVYSLYADRVKTWITINEPLVICDFAYNTGVHAPGVKDEDVANYWCNKHVLIAHAKAWRIYDEEFRPKYHGKASLSNHLLWFEALSEKDLELADLTNEYAAGRFSHAVFSKEGGWPPSIEKIIEENSRKQGYPRSRLPAFTKEEIELVKGTYDFYAFNHYSSRKVRSTKQNEKLETWITDAPELGAKLVMPKEWNATAEPLFPSYPSGIRRMMNWLKNRYGNLTFFITENGYSSKSANCLTDDDRIQFIRSYLEQVLLAIREDGINVMGYTYWSLLDNYEWARGFTIKYGLNSVDFSDPTRKRRPRKSAGYYASIIKKNSLDVPLEPDGWKAVNDKKFCLNKSFRSTNSIFLSIAAIIFSIYCGL